MSKTNAKTEATATAKVAKTPSEKIMSAVAALPKDMNTSGKIRSLFAAGFEKGDIARVLGKRYQHVRNVLITPVKKPAGKSE